MNKVIKGIVVSHTHWDREWYMSFQEYRIWLVKLMDRLLEIFKSEKKYKSFTFDGQVAPIEDYLEIRPEKTKEVKEYIKKNKILIGPFYTQLDEWLASPEAIIRNLLFGLRRAKALGAVMKVGYLPDNFGHPAQIPQILHGFGIDSFVFMRGLGDEGDKLGKEFLWEAPDGSDVIAIYAQYAWECIIRLSSFQDDERACYWAGPEGDVYYNYEMYSNESLYRISENPVHELRKTIINTHNKYRGKSVTNTLLIMDGADHLPPNTGTLKAIEFCNNNYKDIKLVPGTLKDYITEVKKAHKSLKRYKGELWGSRYQNLLSGTISTRMYIKQENFKSQNLLENYAEPLSTLAQQLGWKYPFKLLQRAWQLILYNHAHDSIHGSSVDSVNVEMLSRFQSASQIGNALTYESLYYIGQHVHKSSSKNSISNILVYNPANWERRDFAAVWLDIPIGDFCVIDEDGKKVPFQVLKDKVGFPPANNLKHIEIMAAAVPPLGCKIYEIVSGKMDKAGIRITKTAMENDLIHVGINKDGTLRIKHKKTGTTYDNINLFVDGGDAGDAWDYSPPLGGDKIVESSSFSLIKIEIAEKGSVKGTLKIDLEMKIPKRLKGRFRSKENIKLPITTYVTIYDNTRRIDIKTVVENSMEDHRLRVKFPANLITDTVYSDGHFYTNKRPITAYSADKDWYQPPPTTYHHNRWVAVTDGQKGIAIANKGLPEYETCLENNGVSIYLTLLRCIGIMSKTNLITRKKLAGPKIPVPGAQCKGRHTFEYSIIPFNGEVNLFEVWKEARAFTLPFAAQEIKLEGRGISTPFSFISVSPESLMVSALKKAEDDNGVIIRIYEQYGKFARAKVKSIMKIEKAWLTNLNEKIVKELSIKKNEISLDISPYKIITLKLKLVKDRKFNQKPSGCVQ